MFFLVGISIEITSSAIVLVICVVTAETKKHKSRIKKKIKKHDKILSLANSKLNSVEILISKALVDSNVSRDELVLIKNLLKEFGDIKDEIEITINKSFNYK